MATLVLTELGVSSIGRDGYVKYMKDERPKLGARTSYGLPVLPPPSQPITFFDMVLRASQTVSIRLRIRRDNLYLVGFERQSSAGWLEFNPESGSTHLIDRSTFLGFTGSYIDLESKAGVQMRNIPLGRVALMNAVNELNNTSITGDARARPLIVVLEMICEALRFTYISDDFLSPLFVDSVTTKVPTARMIALLKNWGKLSELLLEREKDPTNYFPPNPPPPEMEIHTYLDAVAVLGILKELPPALRTTTVTNAVQHLTHGDPLVEVIWVKIHNTCDLYGTIQVIDGTGSHYLYNKSITESIKTKPGELVLLTSPDRSISAYDSFTINVGLKDNSNNNTNTINGLISWNALYTSSHVYDQPLQQVVNGEYGSVTVNYVVLSDAVKAELEVTLIKGDDGTARVYGDLTARIGNFEEGSVLFKKALEEKIDVIPGQIVPLLKSAVAAPLNSYLVVQADISPDHEIAKGTAEFPTLLSGTSAKSIYGKNGEIRVKVTWIKEI